MYSDTVTSTIFNLTASKKREFIETLDKWHEANIEYADNYQAICEEILSNTKKRLKASYNRYLYVFNIIKEFKILAPFECKADDKLHNSIINDEQATANNLTNEGLLNDGVSMFYNDLTCFVEGISKFQQHVEEEIVEELFRETIRTADLQVKHAFEMTIKNHATLEKKKESVIKRLTELRRNYKISINHTEQGKRCINNTTDELIIYVNRMKILASSLAFYGQQVLNYRKLAIELNYKYNNCVKEAIIELSRVLRDYFGDVHNILFGRSLQRIVAVDLESKRDGGFEFEELIRNNKALDSVLIFNNITDNNFDKAIRSYKDPNFSILFSSFSRNVYNFKQNPKENDDYLLLLSLDDYFSVYKQQENGGFEKIMNVPIETVKLELNAKTNTIKCFYKEKGVIWDTSKTLNISMDQKLIDDLILMHEFAKDIVKDLTISSPADVLKQLTQDLNSSENLTINEKDTEQSLSDKKTNIDEILYSNISEGENDVKIAEKMNFKNIADDKNNELGIIKDRVKKYTKPNKKAHIKHDQYINREDDIDSSVSHLGKNNSIREIQEFPSNLEKSDNIHKIKEVKEE